MSEEQAVLTERRGRVLIVTLNRPDAMNAINGALSSGLVAAMEELDVTTVTFVGGEPGGFDRLLITSAAATDDTASASAAATTSPAAPTTAAPNAARPFRPTPQTWSRAAIDSRPCRYLASSYATPPE